MKTPGKNPHNIKYTKRETRFFLLMILLFFSMIIQAQVAVNMDGSLPDTSAMLDVKATGLGFLAPRMTEAERPANPATGLIIYQTDNDTGYYYFDGTSWEKVGRGSQDFWTASGADIYYNNGNVGVGTDQPDAKLHVKGGIEVLRLESSTDPMFSFYSGTTFKAWMQAFGDDFYITNKMSGRLRLRTSNVDRLVIEGNGNVVIGATSGATGYKLSVNGKLACDEILIDDQAYWPDYVFDEHYALMPLDKLKVSIQENKHLPGIPSALEVSKNGGFEVGAVQKKMLEKIEELSLYIIQMNDRLSALEQDNLELRKEINKVDHEEQ